MLLPDNIRPENSVYFNGGFVLEALQKLQKRALIDLYQDVKSKQDMSFSIFVLCIDWLFLLDLATLNKNGEVELCS
jgi:hypothetical protein